MKTKNSKVFEQKGDLLSFKVNVDSKLGLMLSHAEPSWAKLSQAEPSWAKMWWVWTIFQTFALQQIAFQ